MEMRMKKGDSWCHIPNYVKHTVEETEKGVTITIYTENGHVHEYICEDVSKRNKKDWSKGYNEWKKNGLH
jgi:hypothetical protein